MFFILNHIPLEHLGMEHKMYGYLDLAVELLYSAAMYKDTV